MKKSFNIFLVLFICIMSLQTYAGKNTVKFTPGFKFGEDIAAPLIDFEYERKIIPLTSVYIKYGTAGFDLDTTDPTTLLASTVTFDFSNFAIGARYDLWLIYIGVGYETTSMDLSDSTTGGAASGSIAGPVIEIGKALSLGPVSLGAGLGIQFASVDISYDTGSVQFDIGDIPESGSMTLIRLQAEFGYSF